LILEAERLRDTSIGLIWAHFPEQSAIDVSPATTVRDVAGFLNVNEKTGYRFAQQRELPGFEVVGAWRFRGRDVEEWIERQKRVAGVIGAGD
jgi:excisionase family DNA binding protein